MRTALLPVPLAVVVIAAPVLLAASARPCSPPLSSLDGTATPDDGALVPTNGVVHARLTTFGLAVRASVRADHEVAARTLDIDDVAGVTRINVEGLAPSTSYTLTLTMPDASPEDGVRASRAIHFTTTRAPDITPPTFTGTADVVVTHQPALDNGFDSCGFGGSDATNTVDILPPPVRDDVGIAGLKLVRVNGDGTRALRMFRLHSSNENDELLQGALVDSEPTPGDYRYELVAVDLAGNESAPLPVDVTVPDTVFGCSAAGPSTSSLALVFVVLLARARRAKMRP